MLNEDVFFLIANLVRKNSPGLCGLSHICTIFLSSALCFMGNGFLLNETTKCYIALQKGRGTG